MQETEEEKSYVPFEPSFEPCRKTIWTQYSPYSGQNS
jgi:hypothetical protein